MKLIQLTQLDGTVFYLNTSYIIRVKQSEHEGSEILVNGNPVTIFTLQNVEDILSLINQ